MHVRGYLSYLFWGLGFIKDIEEGEQYSEMLSYGPCVDKAVMATNELYTINIHKIEPTNIPWQIREGCTGP